MVCPDEDVIDPDISDRSCERGVGCEGKNGANHVCPAGNNAILLAAIGSGVNGEIWSWQSFNCCPVEVMHWGVSMAAKSLILLLLARHFLPARAGSPGSGPSLRGWK